MKAGRVQHTRVDSVPKLKITSKEPVFACPNYKIMFVAKLKKLKLIFRPGCGRGFVEAQILLFYIGCLIYVCYIACLAPPHEILGFEPKLKFY